MRLVGCRPTIGPPLIRDQQIVEDERDLRLAMLWQLRPADLRAVRSWIGAGFVPFPWKAADLDRLRGRWPEGLREELARLPRVEDARRLRCEMERLSIRFLVLEDTAFPARLRVISDPPPFLFVRGEPFHPARGPRVAIIGARAASEPGREIAYALARDLALAGCPIVSGLARGIDGEAHRGALEAGGRTIAVLGTGADLCYPAEHRSIFRQILERGGVVTEFPPGTPVRPLHFPRRNRILAALCDALIVVEGREKSGARSTVDFALDQAKEVMAVPRDILHPGSALPNRLIRDGAVPALSAAEVLAHLPSCHGKSLGTIEEAGGAGSETLDEFLLRLLGERPRDLEACLKAAPATPAGTVSAALSKLEILGRVRRLPGGRFQRAI